MVSFWARTISGSAIEEPNRSADAEVYQVRGKSFVGSPPQVAKNGGIFEVFDGGMPVVVMFTSHHRAPEPVRGPGWVRRLPQSQPSMQSP